MGNLEPSHNISENIWTTQIEST